MQMQISRRLMLQTPLLATKPVRHATKPIDCTSQDNVGDWMNKRSKLEIATNVVDEAKSFYESLLADEPMSVAFVHLNAVREYAKRYEQYKPICEEMVNDARDKYLLSECYKI